MEIGFFMLDHSTLMGIIACYLYAQCAFNFDNIIPQQQQRHTSNRINKSTNLFMAKSLKSSLCIHRKSDEKTSTTQCSPPWSMRVEKSHTQHIIHPTRTPKINRLFFALRLALLFAACLSPYAKIWWYPDFIPRTIFFLLSLVPAHIAQLSDIVMKWIGRWERDGATFFSR